MTIPSPAIRPSAHPLGSGTGELENTMSSKYTVAKILFGSGFSVKRSSPVCPANAEISPPNNWKFDPEPSAEKGTAWPLNVTARPATSKPASNWSDLAVSEPCWIE